MRKVLLLLLVLSTAAIQGQCWQSVSAGFVRSFGIKSDGTLWAWGQNSTGLLGDGTYVDRSSPVRIGTASNWQAIAMGDFHTIGLKTDGTLWAWGQNFDGQLGDGTNTSRATPVQIGTATNWQAISAGFGFNLAKKADGTLWTWGQNSAGQLGLGLGNVDVLVPTQITGMTNCISFSAGGAHALIIKSNGTLWACGLNSSGQLGIGSSVNKNTYVQVGTAADWRMVSAGGYNSFAIKNANTLWSWGQNQNGALGTGDLFNRNVVGAVGSSTDWQTVYAGDYHMMAKKTNGTLWACGGNAFGVGQFGTMSPLQLSTATNWDAVSVGDAHFLATKTDHTLTASGGNYYGQIGNGTSMNSVVLGQVSCSSLDTSEFNGRDLVFKISPNPVQSALDIYIPLQKTIDYLTISDMLGKEIYRQYGNTQRINVSQLQNGMYLLRLFSNGMVYDNKFIKQ